MKTLISILTLVLSFNLCSAQHYSTQNEMDLLAAIVQEFEVNYAKLMVQKDPSAAKQIKKNIFVLSSQMRAVSDKISASVSIDEMQGMGSKRASFMDSTDLPHKLIKVEYTKAKADKLSQYAHNMMNVKADLKMQDYKINLGSEADLELVKKFKDNLMSFHEIQTSTFNKAFKKATS